MSFGYGGLAQRYHHTPEHIGAFFNRTIIRNREQRALTGTVDISAQKNIAKRTLEPASQVRIVNTGPAPLRFYFAPEANDAPGQTGRTVAPGEDETIEVRALGTGPFLEFGKRGHRRRRTVRTCNGVGKSRLSATYRSLPAGF